MPCGQRFDWDDLQFFLAVARAGTISLAGRRLGTDHATVGRRVSALETALASSCSSAIRAATA